VKLPRNVLTVARRLGGLRERVVFVGGSILEILLTDAAANARPTLDVDVITDVESRVAMSTLANELRGCGLREDTSDGAPICRWIVDDVPVDVMPTNPSIYGFTNVWYPSGMVHALTIKDDDGTAIRILDAPHFCATKLEAFASRSDGDVYHHDLEDFISVVDNRPTLVREIEEAPPAIASFIVDEVKRLLATPTIVEALPGHLRADAASQARLPFVLAQLHAIATIEPLAPASESTAPSTRRGGFTSRRTPPRIPVTALRWMPMRSTNVIAVTYDPSSSTLGVEFTGGRLYEYDDVPSTVYEGFARSASAGRYVHEWVRGRYAYRRVA
jgi:hypothetical protein